MKERFTIGKEIVEDRMNFIRCLVEISPEEGDTIGMHE